MESGNPISFLACHGSAFYQPAYDAIAQATNCTDKVNTLQCLRSVPFAQLNMALNTTFAVAWGFVVDGDFIQKYGSIQLARGEFVQVPIIDGANTDEGTAFGPVGVDHDTAFISYLESVLIHI
jgi:carboxylesterase type B